MILLTVDHQKQTDNRLFFHWTGLSSISAAAVLNTASRCRRFFSLNNKQHEANLPPLSLYIYNSARLLTFSCAHLEDRTNRNNTVPYQKPGYLTTVSSADIYSCIYSCFNFVNKVTSNYFQEVKSHVRDVSMGSTAAGYRGEERTLISHLLMLTDLLTVVGGLLHSLFISYLAFL